MVGVGLIGTRTSPTLPSPVNRSMNRRPPSSTARHFWNVPNSKKAYDSVTDLALYNPLLFRVSHRNSGSFYFEGEGVVANGHYSVDAVTGELRLNATIDELCKRPSGAVPVPADKLVEHVLYSKTERTNFVSTTFSFTWALFFAEMNANNWKEEDVELLVIDTFAVAARAWVAHEQLSRICPDWWSNASHKKILNATYSAQEVIVPDCIPESAIISRVPWAHLKTKLPSWFFDRSSRPESYQLNPIADAGQARRYVCWQKAAQDQLAQILSRKRKGFNARKEAVAFVIAAFAPRSATATEVVLKNGPKSWEEFEPLVKRAARILLNWSRPNNSPSINTKDEKELCGLIHEGMSQMFKVEKAAR